MKKSGSTLVEVLVVCGFVGTVAVMAAVACLLVKGCNYVCDNGVKSVAEKVWEGNEEL